MRISVPVFVAVVFFASPALATNWPIPPLDVVHALGNNWGTYSFGNFHPGIDVMTHSQEGEEVRAVRHGWVKGWGTIGDKYYYRLAVCDTNSDFTDRAEGWLYAHIDSSRYHKQLGDEVQESELIGYLVPWPTDGFNHLHFARISDTGATWMRYPNVTWWFIQNPLTIIQPNTDWEAPVIQDARPNQKFAFCRNNTNNSYLSYDSLVGDVDIVAKIYDKTGMQCVNPVWEKLAPYEIDYSIKREDGWVVVPWKISVQFSNRLDQSLVHVVYKDDSVCPTKGDYDYREYYFIVTNTDGDSIVDSYDTCGMWSTGRYGDTTYWVYVRASDVYGNTTVDSMQVRSRNSVTVEEPPFAVLSRPLRAVQTASRNGLISFGTAGSGIVRLRVYDPLGREVGHLADGRLSAGGHQFSFTPPAAGIYVVKLTIDGKNTYNSKLVAHR
jgi:hypothetical protein